MNRKGQAAIEFLLTYGWAILIVLAAVSSSVYFGVLKSDRFLPEICVMPPSSGLFCEDFSSSPGIILLRIKNNNPESINITSASVSQDGDSCYLPLPPLPVPSSGSVSIGLTAGSKCLNLTKPGKKIKAEASISLTKNTIPRTVKVDIVTKAEKVSLLCANADKKRTCDGLATLKKDGFFLLDKDDCCKFYDLCC